MAGRGVGTKSSLKFRVIVVAVWQSHQVIRLIPLLFCRKRRGVMFGTKKVFFGRVERV
jgi:hypothetical protein